jgi:hypothetical protein
MGHRHLAILPRFSTFILDLSVSAEDLDHTAIALRHADGLLEA